jgi:hypothetical protein
VVQAETVNRGQAAVELVATLDEAAITVNGHLVAAAHQAAQTTVVTLAQVLAAALAYTGKEARAKDSIRHGAAKTHQVVAALVVVEDKLAAGDKIHGTALALNLIISMAAHTAAAAADLVQVGLHQQVTVA